MQALEAAISRKIAGRPPSRTRCAHSLTTVSEMEASTSTGRPTIPAGLRAPAVRGENALLNVPAMRVWVDLTNSPHVLVMRPVIARLREQGHSVEVTARDFAQTLELCDRLGIEHTTI